MLQMAVGNLTRALGVTCFPRSVTGLRTIRSGTRERERDRQTDRQTETETDRDRQTITQTDRHRQRQTD